MGNVIKSGTTMLNAVVKNTTFKVGIDGVENYGPTESTGFWSGITPPVSGYTIYVHKQTQGPSIHVANNDDQCIFFLKSFGATGTTISDVLAWSNSQTNLWVQSADLTVYDIDPTILSGHFILSQNNDILSTTNNDGIEYQY